MPAPAALSNSNRLAVRFAIFGWGEPHTVRSPSPSQVTTNLPAGEWPVVSWKIGVSTHWSVTRLLTQPFPSVTGVGPVPHVPPVFWLIHGRDVRIASTKAQEVFQSVTPPRFMPILGVAAPAIGVGMVAAV